MWILNSFIKVNPIRKEDNYKVIPFKKNWFNSVSISIAYRNVKIYSNRRN